MALNFPDALSNLLWTNTGPLPTFEAVTALWVMKRSDVYGAMFDFAKTTNGWEPAANIGLNGSGNVCITKHSGTTIITGPSTTAGEYYGVAFVSDGGGNTANGVRLYVRRLFDGSSTSLSQSNWASTSYVGAAVRMYIGADIDTGGNTYGTFPGTLENFQIFDKVLTQAQIEASWYRRVPMFGPVRWLPMVGDTVADNAMDLATGVAWTRAGLTVATTQAPISWGGSAPARSTALAAITGTASPTLGALTLSATGVAPIVGTASLTLGALTLSATGVAPIVGTASLTLGALTLIATETIGGSVNSGTKSCAYRTSGMATYDNFSACAWFYIRDRSYPLIVGMAEGTSYNRWSIGTDGLCRCWHSTNHYWGTSVVPLDTWVHIGWKRVGNDLSIYYNGTLEITVGSAATFTKTTERVGGEYDTNVPNHAFAALKMWNADLSGAEFAAEMYGYAAVRTADLHTVTRFTTDTDMDNEVGGGTDWTNENLTTNNDVPDFLASAKLPLFIHHYRQQGFM